jgi:EmrB/QacA subfamily drug resistance transporter
MGVVILGGWLYPTVASWGGCTLRPGNTCFQGLYRRFPSPSVTLWIVSKMRRYFLFFSASLSLLMYSIDGTAVAVAFPQFIKELDTNVLWAAWTMSIFYIGVVTAMPLAGKISDSFGRKKIFLISLVLFTSGSLACGRAPNIYTLIGFRFIQGVGGACFLPTASGIVSDHFPDNRETVIGLFTSIFVIGSIIGPNLGGWIVSRYSWRYVFYINLPIGICLLFLIMILLKEKVIVSQTHIDFVGASFFSGAVLFVMFGLNLIGENFSGLALLSCGVFLVISLSFGLLFLRQEKKETNPMLDIALLRSKPFLAANLLNMIIGAGVMGLFAFIPLYATSVHKLSTLMSGMILTPRSLGTITASTVTSFLLRRWGYRWPMVMGLAIISTATILLAPGLQPWRMIENRLGIVGTISLLVLVSGIGAGIALPASNNACIELMPERVATIVGLRGMFRTVGGALGVSLITLILHASPNRASGFNIAFISFGLGLMCGIPLVFLMPAGKQKISGWSDQNQA